MAGHVDVDVRNAVEEIEPSGAAEVDDATDEVTHQRVGGFHFATTTDARGDLHRIIRTQVDAIEHAVAVVVAGVSNTASAETGLGLVGIVGAVVVVVIGAVAIRIDVWLFIKSQMPWTSLLASVGQWLLTGVLNDTDAVAKKQESRSRHPNRNRRNRRPHSRRL